MILILDNYDSFTYNLYQYVGEFRPDVTVLRSDAVTAAEVEAMRPTHILLSPGPGRPKDAGVTEEVVRRMAGKANLLGICLGHQAVCEAYGARIVHAARLMHGRADQIYIASGSRLFEGLAPVISAARYHSLAVDRATLPDELLVIAEDGDGAVMGVKHAAHNLYGLQFHPESVLTPDGKTILRNFLAMEDIV